MTRRTAFSRALLFCAATGILCTAQRAALACVSTDTCCVPPAQGHQPTVAEIEQIMEMAGQNQLGDAGPPLGQIHQG